MDYRVRELTLCEKTAFRTAALAAGILAGHLFYDSFAAGLIIGILMFFLEKPFREALKERRQRVLAGQFKERCLFHVRRHQLQRQRLIVYDDASKVHVQFV